MVGRSTTDLYFVPIRNRVSIRTKDNHKHITFTYIDILNKQKIFNIYIIIGRVHRFICYKMAANSRTSL